MNETRSIPRFSPNTARKAFQLLDRLDSDSRRKLPTLLTVFRLYCVQRMNVVQIAQHCRCSVGTVSNRLALLRARTGLHPKSFRAS